MSESITLPKKNPTSTDKKQVLPNSKENISHEKKFEEGLQLFNKGNYIEAIEIFSILSNEGNDVARKYLARCYYRLDNYEAAYKHFKYLADNAEVELRDYGSSMVAAIEIMHGNYNKAIQILKALPYHPRNIINLAIVYWKKYKVTKDELAIREAMKILNKIDSTSVSKKVMQSLYHIKALIFQSQKEFKLAESCYLDALDLAEDDIDKGAILNDYASLFIEMGNYSQAEQKLELSRTFITGKSEVEEAFNNKWLGIISIQKSKYPEAKEYLSKAVQIIREKALLGELTGIVFFLANQIKGNNFIKAAEVFSDGLTFVRLWEEVKDRDEKIIDFIYDSFFGRGSNNTGIG